MTSQPTSAEAAPHVLIVEDSKDVRTYVRELLKNSGFAVTEADSGETALMLLASAAIDGVLTDIQMPGISGIELCKRIKGLDLALNQKTPVWMMTASTDSALSTAARDAGAEGVFEKPFDAKKIVEALRDELSP